MKKVINITKLFIKKFNIFFYKYIYIYIYIKMSNLYFDKFLKYNLKINTFYEKFSKMSKNDYLIELLENPELIQFATPDIKDDIDCINLVLQQNGNLLLFASDTLKDNELIVDIAINNNKNAIQYASSRIQLNYNYNKLVYESLNNLLFQEYTQTDNNIFFENKINILDKFGGTPTGMTPTDPLLFELLLTTAIVGGLPAPPINNTQFIKTGSRSWFIDIPRNALVNPLQIQFRQIVDLSINDRIDLGACILDLLGTPIYYVATLKDNIVKLANFTLNWNDPGLPNNIRFFVNIQQKSDPAPGVFGTTLDQHNLVIVPTACRVLGCTKCAPGASHYCRNCKNPDSTHRSIDCPSLKSSAASKGLGFGSPPPPPSKGLGFGSTPPPPSKGLGFGSPPPPPSKGLGFGSTPPPPSKGLGFGSPPPPPSKGLGFGSTPPPPSKGLGFGSPPPPPSKGLGFGSTPPPPSKGLGFGSPPPPPSRLLRLGARPPIKGYHQTSQDSAVAILSSGTFRIGSKGSVGAGIYFAENRGDTNHKALSKGVILEVELFLGNPFHIQDYKSESLTRKDFFRSFTSSILDKAGYDSVITDGWTSGREFCVFNTDQVRNIKVVYIDKTVVTDPKFLQFLDSKK